MAQHILSKAVREAFTQPPVVVRKRLDPKRSYGTNYGNGLVTFEQDGVTFGPDGNPVETTEVTPHVERDGSPG